MNADESHTQMVKTVLFVISHGLRHWHWLLKKCRESMANSWMEIFQIFTPNSRRHLVFVEKTVAERKASPGHHRKTSTRIETKNLCTKLELVAVVDRLHDEILRLVDSQSCLVMTWISENLSNKINICYQKYHWLEEINNGHVVAPGYFNDIFLGPYVERGEKTDLINK